MGSSGGFKTFVEYNGTLIAGNGEGVFQWNGGSWTSIGAAAGGGPYFDSYGVKALAVYDGDLIAGGHFDTIAGVRANRIARWNGATWSPLGGGVEGTSQPSVRALTVHEGELIAAGLFDTAGGIGAASVARWNGASWSPLGDGLGVIVPVNALAVYQGDVIAGGHFIMAKWNGQSWKFLDGAPGGVVIALFPFGDELIFGGSFCHWIPYAGCVADGAAWTWNGTTWSAMGEGTWVWPEVCEGDGVCGGVVNALTVHAGHLFAGGNFDLHMPDQEVVHDLAWWNGTTWQMVGSGLHTHSSIDALTSFEGRLIAAGSLQVAPVSCGEYVFYPTASWQGCKPLIRGDLNGDGAVDGTDLAILLGAWGSCAGCTADINDDGVVDGSDLAIVLGGWAP